MNDPVNDPANDPARLYLALGRLQRELRRDVPDATVGHGGLSALATLVDRGPVRLGTLAEIEGISAPSTTRIVSFLASLGHVRRTPDPTDGRASLIEITESGAALVTQGRSQRMRALAARCDRLDPGTREGIAAAVHVLERLSESAPDAE